MSIEKRVNKAGKVFYYDTENKRFSSSKAFARNLGNIEYEELEPTLSKAQKLAYKASQRIRINGKFITKRKETFLKETLENKGVNIKDVKDFTNILDQESLNDILSQRSKIKEQMQVYSKGWNKKERKRTEIFDIFKEIADSHRAGRKFRINGKDVTIEKAIKKVSAFINKHTTDKNNPPLYIWNLIFSGDGDILDIDLDATEVIQS